MEYIIDCVVFLSVVVATVIAATRSVRIEERTLRRADAVKFVRPKRTADTIQKKLLAEYAEYNSDETLRESSTKIVIPSLFQTGFWSALGALAVLITIWKHHFRGLTQLGLDRYVSPEVLSDAEIGTAMLLIVCAACLAIGLVMLAQKIQELTARELCEIRVRKHRRIYVFQKLTPGEKSEYRKAFRKAVRAKRSAKPKRTKIIRIAG